MAQALKSSVKLPVGSVPILSPQQNAQQQISNAVQTLLRYATEQNLTLPQMQDVCINLQLWVFEQMRMLVHKAMEDKPKEASKIIVPK